MRQLGISALASGADAKIQVTLPIRVVRDAAQRRHLKHGGRKHFCGICLMRLPRSVNKIVISRREARMYECSFVKMPVLCMECFKYVEEIKSALRPK